MYRKMLFGESNSKDTMKIASNFFPYLKIISKDW